MRLEKKSSKKLIIKANDKKGQNIRQERENCCKREDRIG
jgi:hypothetical protein